MPGGGFILAEEGAPPPSSRPASLIGASVYHGGRKVADIGIDEGGEWSRREGHLVWIGLLEPSDAELRIVQQQFDLNQLAIDDAAQAHQRPKIQRYGDSLFIVARTAEMIDERIQFGESHLFVGCGFVVSIRQTGWPSEIRTHCSTPSAPNV